MLLIKFIYNNANNISNNDIIFKLNCKYQFSILYKHDIDVYLKFRILNKLIANLKKVLTIYKKNFYYT